MTTRASDKVGEDKKLNGIDNDQEKTEQDEQGTSPRAPPRAHAQRHGVYNDSSSAAPAAVNYDSEPDMPHLLPADSSDSDSDDGSSQVNEAGVLECHGEWVPTEETRIHRRNTYYLNMPLQAQVKAAEEK
jgi:hypothetical protein